MSEPDEALVTLEKVRLDLITTALSQAVALLPATAFRSVSATWTTAADTMSVSVSLTHGTEEVGNDE